MGDFVFVSVLSLNYFVMVKAEILATVTSLYEQSLLLKIICHLPFFSVSYMSLHLFLSENHISFCFFKNTRDICWANSAPSCDTAVRLYYNLYTAAISDKRKTNISTFISVDWEVINNKPICKWDSNFTLTLTPSSILNKRKPLT